MSKASVDSNGQLFRFLATLFLIVAILALAKTVLIPIVLAILFSFLLNPLVRILQCRGLKRVWAVLVVTVFSLIFFSVLTWAILTQVVAFADEFPKFKTTISKKFQTILLKPIQKLTNQTPDESIGISSAVAIPALPTGHGPISAAVFFNVAAAKSKIFANEESADKALAEATRIDPMTVLNFLARSAQEGVRLGASFGVVIVLVILMLIFREEMRDRFIGITGNRRLTVTTRALDEASRRISDYMMRKFIVNAIFGAAVTMLLFLIGVRFSLMWGLLLVLLRFIPGLGVWLSAIPPALVAMITFESWLPVAMVLLVYGVGELLLINVIEPRYVGTQIGLFPVAGMISLTFWTWLWGPIGLFLAIPLTTCLAVLGKHVPQLSFLGVLFSDHPAMDSTLRYYQRLVANDQDEAMEIVDEYLARHDISAVYENLMVPALSYARRDLAGGALSQTDLDFFFHATREILDDVRSAAPSNNDTHHPMSDADYSIVGCPIGDDADALALQMTAQQLKANNRSMQVGPPNKLSSEIVEWVTTYAPDVVCLASIAPGHLAQTRFVCKRLRSQFPDIKIVVARLGEADDFSRDCEVLTEAGADHVCATVADSRNAILQALKELSYEKVKTAAT